MRTFFIVWLGQTVSIIGSGMTSFAFTIWVWELTGQATALTLFGFFSQVPQILIAPLAGVIVDRWSRKYLIMLGDTLSGLLTITVLVLCLTHYLHLWHLYVVVTVMGTFEQFQKLAYSASMSLMVSKKQYSRISSMSFLANYGSIIIAPALAGSLYIMIGLVGILIIDIISFAIAVSTVLWVRIPQPSMTEVNSQSHTNIQQDLSFGLRYIAARPSLIAMLVSISLFWFAYDIGNSLYSPMILARSGNDASLLGSLASAAGIGGIAGALLVSSWGGFKRQIHGMLLGMVGTGLIKTLFGVGMIPLIWISTQFCSSLTYPLLGSSSDTIWLSKVRPNLQGRVFAMRSVITLLTSATAYLLAGPLADYVFEPAMMPGGSLAPLLGRIFGTGKGAGMALLYVISALGLLLVGLSGYAFRTLRDVEMILPDHDASAGSSDGGV
ncbi:MFS transporter [Nostocales cyanobacterium HT-58-2]|nr:MFS transporter [Nostocales cyanobacterium HT-58-2]